MDGVSGLVVNSAVDPIRDCPVVLSAMGGRGKDNDGLAVGRRFGEGHTFANERRDPARIGLFEPIQDEAMDAPARMGAAGDDGLELRTAVKSVLCHLSDGRDHLLQSDYRKMCSFDRYQHTAT